MSGNEVRGTVHQDRSQERVVRHEALRPGRVKHGGTHHDAHC